MSKYERRSNRESQDPSPGEVSRVGLMIFREGVFYIGFFNENYRFEGEGLFFFSVGALLKGDFINGKVHGKALITLPSDILLLASFQNGKLVEQFDKLNLELKVLTHH